MFRLESPGTMPTISNFARTRNGILRAWWVIRSEIQRAPKGCLQVVQTRPRNQRVISQGARAMSAMAAQAQTIDEYLAPWSERNEVAFVRLDGAMSVVSPMTQQ